jgi:hypothetical protein
MKVIIMKMAVFWIVAACSLAEVYRPDDGGSKHFKHLQTSTRLHGATTQKKAIFIFAAVKT